MKMRESVQPTYFSSWRENWSFFCRGVAQTTFISFARTPLSWTQVNVDLQRYLTRREFLGSRPLIFCAERCINLLKILKSCEVSRWRVCGRACAYTCVFHRSKMKTFAHVWKQTTFISFARTPLQTTFISFARTPLSWTQVNVDLQRYLTRKEFLGLSTPKALWKHSQSTLDALPTHSQCTPNALSNHSQSTPKALPKHSQSAQSRFWLAKLKLCISCSVSPILCYTMRSEPIVKTSFQ